MSLQEARVALDQVEPGFLDAQDKNAHFLKTEVLGATTASDAPPALGASERRAAAVDKAAAYLKAKQAAGKTKEAPELRDAQAALLAAQKGPKQAAAKQFLELRKKQQAAAAYLAAKKAAEGIGDASSGG